MDSSLTHDTPTPTVATPPSSGGAPVQRSPVSRGLGRGGGGYAAQAARLAPIQLKPKKDKGAPTGPTPNGPAPTGPQGPTPSGGPTPAPGGPTQGPPGKKPPGGGGGGGEPPPPNAGGADPNKDQDPKTQAEVEQYVRRTKNWDEIRNKYAKAKPDLMKMFCDFRKQDVDARLTFILNKKELEGVKKGGDQGSARVASDYDITLFGEKAGSAVGAFNKDFRASYKAESGTVFDTNVYAENFIQDKKEDKKKDAPNDHHDPVKGGKGFQAQDDANMDIASLTKVRKNMSTADWANFVTSVLAGITDANRAAECQRRFEAADSQYKNVYVRQMIVKLQTDDPTEVNRLRRAGKGDEAIVAELAGAASGVAAANRIYEKKLLAVEKLVGERKVLLDQQKTQGTSALLDEQIAKKTIAIRQAQSDALLFANQPYFSAGTIRHVVGGQKKLDLDLGPNELFQSFNENFGDTLKGLGHTTGQLAEDLIEISKYVTRLLAAGEGLAKKTATVVPGLADLVTAFGKIYALRGDKVPTENQKKDVIATARGVGCVPLTALKSRITGISTFVNTTMRAKGAAGSSVEGPGKK